jgi:stress-induced morphogen
MGMKSEEILAYIHEAFPDADVDLKDLAGDHNHYALTIASPAFEGITKIMQHKMVYQALKGHVGDTLHALSITTLPKKP